jgi:hypothetical protein
MTKTQEIERLKEFANSLGEDSYLGEWLKYVLPEVEMDIRSDIIPYVTPSQTRKASEEIIQDAKERAAGILKSANEEKKRLVDAALVRIKDVQSNFAVRLQNAVSEASGFIYVAEKAKEDMAKWF